MGSDWIAQTLSNCVTLLSGGTPSKAESTYWNGDLPWISAKDLKSFRIADSEDHLTKAGRGQVARIVPPETVLILVRGMTLHNHIPICITTEESAFNQDVKAVLPKNGLENKYLPYLLLGNKDVLQSYVDSAGHGTGRLNTDTLNRMPFLLPPTDCQKAITHVLGTLDDKIELLRQMNENLEAMARALFQSWFVDFHPVRKKADGLPTGLPKEIEDLFPSEFEDSELGEIPKGWNASVTSAIYKVTIGKTPPRKESRWFSTSENDIPWISIKDMGNASVYVKDASEYLTVEAVERFNVVRIPQDTVVVSFKLTVGRVAITQRAMLSNEAIAHFLRKADTYLSSEFLYCYLKSYDFGELGSTSSIGTAVNSESIRSIKILVPTPEVHSAFSEHSKFVFHQIAQNLDQLQVLTKLRDSLLPVLISGDLELSDDMISQILEPAK